MNFPTDEDLVDFEYAEQEDCDIGWLIKAARDRNRLAAENERLTEQCSALDSSNRAFQEDRRLTGELTEAHKRLTTELAEARARLIPEEERRKLEGDVLTAESASAELCDQLERVQRDLGKARADLFTRGALIASLTKERDECAARLTQEVIDFDRTARELGAILDAWKRYQRNDLSREEFEGVIAERVAYPAVNISSADLERLTNERDEAVHHDRAIEEMLTGVQAENRVLRAERDEARDGYHALDRSWETVHNAAMNPIREAVGLPEATVPELCAEINRLREKPVERRALAKAMLLRAREVYMRDDVLTWDESVRVVAGEVDSGAFDGKD